MLDFMTSAIAAPNAPVQQFDPDILRTVIVRIVARDFGLDWAALLATTRGTPEAAIARQVAMYLAHVGFALNFAMVGRMFGRDRTTVSHACCRIEDRRDDAAFETRLAVLEAACRAAASGYAR